VADGDLLLAAATDIEREARSFLWVLNYAVDQAIVKTSAVKVLRQRTATPESSTVRSVDGVYTVLLVNELRALICFPRVTTREVYETDLSCGFLVTASNMAYRLLVELFVFLWDRSSTRAVD
jgi:hypothetical protein